MCAHARTLTHLLTHSRHTYTHTHNVQEMIREVQCPNFYLPPPLYLEHPSHLHIDLLPRAQGKGMGTSMIRTILAVLKAKGVLGVCVGGRDGGYM